MSQAKIAQTIAALAEYYDKKLNPVQLALFVEDLSGLSLDQLNAAVKKYRLDPSNSFFPLPAKLIALAAADDGRPGAEEAWSLAPKHDGCAAYLTDEVMSAWKEASDLLRDGGDMVSARMVFKEVYERTVKEHRSQGLKPKWWLSRASGTGSEVINESALRDAVEKKRLPETTAMVLLPTYAPQKSTQQALPEGAAAIRKLISETMKPLGDLE